LLVLQNREEHELTQKTRREQNTLEFKAEYATRAGIEGTLSQGERGFDMRHARYIGLAKTHLQQLTSAAAINLVRAVNWMDRVPLAKTRTSHFAALAKSAA
jgi:transposase